MGGMGFLGSGYRAALRSWQACTQAPQPTQAEMSMSVAKGPSFPTASRPAGADVLPPTSAPATVEGNMPVAREADPASPVPARPLRKPRRDRRRGEVASVLREVIMVSEYRW